MRVGLVTCSKLPHLDADDRLLLDALVARGINAVPLIWSDVDSDWSKQDLCVVRSTWDYAERYSQFIDWAEAAAGVTELWNPLEVIRWNTHKSYLCDLAQRGINIVPAVWREAGSEAELERVMSERGWHEVVIKPAIGATARNTLRVGEHNATEGQVHLERWLAAEDMLVQVFLPSVYRQGEASLVFIDGEFSHAARKRPTGGDYRVQAEFGGSLEPFEPGSQELKVAGDVLGAVGSEVLYARVDLVSDEAGELCLMELELVEPQLFLGQSAQAVDRLADAIEDRLDRKRSGN